MEPRTAIRARLRPTTEVDAATALAIQDQICLKLDGADALNRYLDKLADPCYAR